MQTRMKRDHPGIHVKLRPGDLLIAQILPKSLNVHLVDFIVSKEGELEFGQWITGVEDGFKHKVQEITADHLEYLGHGLGTLYSASCAVDFPESFDYFEYENENRVVLTFWVDDREFSAFLPDDRFFTDYGVDDGVASRYKDVFLDLVHALPVRWIDTQCEGGFVLS